MPEDLDTGQGGLLSEAQVVYWLKRALVRKQFFGDSPRDILVDADGSYLNSPFKKALEPTGSIRIGNWRADLVCLLYNGDVERVVGFEVKARTDLEKGIVQASRYLVGVHESYLCVPETDPPSTAWLADAARTNRIGLVLASEAGVDIRVPPPVARPDPRILLTTRRYLSGEGTVRALGLNKPLHYAAVLIACIESEDPAHLIRTVWGLNSSAVRHAFRGAETLGLVSNGHATPKGKAYAGAFRAMGFSLRHDRALTKVRLADHNPGYAALLRAILLDNPAVQLIVRTLDAVGGGPISADRLAGRAYPLDEGMARAVFGDRPSPDMSWEIRPSTRFNLKAALYDTGILSTPLSAGAASGVRGRYAAARDMWGLAQL